MPNHSANATPTERNTDVIVSGVSIPCRLSLPAGQANGAVLIIPGSLYSDVDGNYPSINFHPHAYADLAKQLYARGFAVLRMAKIGPGTGSQITNLMLAGAHVEFSSRATVAAAGLTLLREACGARPLIVAGHSEGAMAVSMLAAGGGTEARLIDGVVSLSGPAAPILDVMRAQVEALTPPGMGSDMALFDHTVAAIRAGRTPSGEAAANPQTTMLATLPPPAMTYVRSADRIDPAAALAKVRQPVLILQGGRDVSVPASHAEALAAARGALPTETVVFPELNHFYKFTPANLPPMQSMMLQTDSDEAVADAIADWSQRLAATL